MPSMRGRRVIVVGCGTFGASLASSLSRAGRQVCVMDMDQASFGRLSADFDGETVTGSGTNVSVLEGCGVADASTVVAATDRDTVNVLIGEMASDIYGVAHVYARVDDEALVAIAEDHSVETICPHLLCALEFYRLAGLSSGVSAQ